MVHEDIFIETIKMLVLLDNLNGFQMNKEIDEKDSDTDFQLNKMHIFNSFSLKS